MGMSCTQRSNLFALFLRLGLASLFLVSAQNKLGSPGSLYPQVAGSHLLPPGVDVVFATALPYWELLFGVCLLLGVFTRGASIGALLALTSYTIYQMQPGSQARLATLGLGQAMISHNLTFILACVAMTISGAGAYSLDALIAGRHALARNWSAVRESIAPDLN
jgi:uncharacterized membrane protein YphA (DoxX/SURF4 family)